MMLKKQLLGQEKKPMRVVLDTNVLISAFLFNKQVGRIIELMDQGVITPCFIDYTFQELINVLHYEKFKPVLINAKFTTDEIIESINIKSIILSNPQKIPKLIPDSADNFILAAASKAKVSFIVTGDKLLLSFKKYQKIPILSPQKFLELF